MRQRQQEIKEETDKLIYSQNYDQNANLQVQKLRQESEALYAKENEIAVKLNRNTEYSLKSVRTTSKDQSIKAVTCEAELYVEGSGLQGIKKNIRFSIQITEDGDLYAEIFN